ncbi:MAG TPA: MarC family protein [Blastocatellia bacterium]|jgi:small neutral amino acid transporter SnatA (MarC family)
MLFGHRAGLQAPESGEHATAGEDIAIFPLAISLHSGPGEIASILLLASQANNDPRRLVLLGAMILIVYAVPLLVLHLGGQIMTKIGEGKVHIATRVLGIVLIGYDGSESADAALDDLRRAGLPRETEALIVSVGEVLTPPSSDVLPLS